MQRRAFAKTALGALAGGALLKSPQSAHAAPCSDFPKVNGVTDYVAAFVETTKYDDIPADVIELGKKSILDGLGWLWQVRKRKPAGCAVSTLKSWASVPDRPPLPDRR